MASTACRDQVRGLRYDQGQVSRRTRHMRRYRQRCDETAGEPFQFCCPDCWVSYAEPGSVRADDHTLRRGRPVAGDDPQPHALRQFVARQHQPPRYRRTHQRMGVPERLIQLGQRFSCITDWNCGNPRIRQQHWRARESSPARGSPRASGPPASCRVSPLPWGPPSPGGPPSLGADRALVSRISATVRPRCRGGVIRLSRARHKG